MTPSPAPVTIPAYCRLQHLKRTLEALRNNRLADRTEVFITSDGPRPGDEEQVAAVRAFLRTVDGFKRVEVIEREKNNNLENWRFRSQLAQTYGRVILIEDDCVTAPGFLSFMNSCLDRYADDPTVFGITGFLPPILGHQSRPPQLYRLQRFKAWGCGIYGRSDAMVRFHPTPEEFNALVRSKTFRRELMQRSGFDLMGMLHRCATGRLQAYDVMASLEMIRRGMRMIFPSGSLVENIGFDGSGLNCGASNRFKTSLLDEPEVDWSVAPDLIDPEIDAKVARFYGSTYRAWLRFHSKRLRGRLKISSGLDKGTRS